MAETLLLPPVLASDPRFRALGQLTGRISQQDLSPLLVYLVDQVDTELLPVLAEQFHVMGDEGWLLASDERQQRALIKRAIELHRYKGTLWAVQEVFRVLGINAELLEWWQQQPEGIPYTFSLKLWANDNWQDKNPLLSAELYHRLKCMVDEAKPVRCSYALHVGARFDQGVYLASAGQARAIRRTGAHCLPAPAKPIFQPAQLASAGRARAVLRLSMEG
ncbi:phage tail P2-like protein [Chromobacterium alkanivorans]|uniref:phage tail protein I n=1 Tax=Chromobacterium alkanivorans TaxID=1071719 RepID=UPI00216A0011|nr:phage tail protein I [Chromobacterium alkanivorans]MCS3806685.1 phage tail P2-like protein [Chromobacterium alkanivorans]MCS3821143.1 phage tail P2-like protein [Chromobacterium alkanivorans]MCS3875945.1 phage tail P2-like protein [Chromobacterium alkanivorans]